MDELETLVSLDKKVMDEHSIIRVIQFSTKSGEYSARQIFKEKLERCLRCFWYKTDDIKDISLAFGEAYSNAVIHGNKSAHPDYYKLREQEIPKNIKENKNKLIYITTIINWNFVMISVEDEGNGYDHSGKIEFKIYSEHGNGRALIKEKTDFQHYNSSGNKIYFTKNRIKEKEPELETIDS